MMRNRQALRRARQVVEHWRERADAADAIDAEATARADDLLGRPVVTYVPASDALRLAADRLERALDGER